MKASSIKDWEFSLFYHPTKGLFNCTPYKSITLDKLFEIYQSPYLITKSNELKTASDEQKVLIKSLLPYFTYSGVFTYRNNESIVSYNSSLLPLDIDGLSEQDAIQVQFNLSIQKGCVMSILSPRGKGVKALFFLGNEIEIENHYSTLCNNVEHIAKQLNIEDFVSNIDKGQWKLCQPFFIGYNDHNFFNLDAQPTNWGVVDVPKKIVEYIPPKTRNHKFSSNIEQKRIEGYVLNECSRVENYLSQLGEGDRHSNIWRVGGCASLIHYVPHLSNEIEQRLFIAVVGMYKSEQEAKNTRAIKTFRNIWDNAQPKNNKIIEQIINEYSINLKSLEQ